MNAHRCMARAVVAGLLLAGSGTVRAQFDYTLSFGVEHNDNIRLAAEGDEESQTSLRPSLGFSFDRAGAVLQANVYGIIDHRNYLGDERSDQTRGHLLGTVNWMMVPNRLTWSFSDALNVRPINELQADTPDNRQQTNVFATGPTLFFDLGRSARGQAELRYIDSYAEETGRFNSQRVSAALRGIKELSETSSASINLQGQRVEFDDSDALPPITQSPDYDRYDAYLGYSRTLTNVDLDLAAGYSQLRFEDVDDDHGGPLFRADLGWRASARSTLNLALAYQYTDAAGSMLNAVGTIGVPTTDIDTGDASVTSQPFRERRADLGYSFAGDRWGFNVTPYYRELEYINSPELDREGSGIRASVSRALRARLNWTLYAAAENLDYQTIDRSIEHRSYGTTLGYQMTQRVSWHFSLRHVERDSSPFGIAAEQNIAYLWITFGR